MSVRDTISSGVTWLQHQWMGRPDQVIYFRCGLGDDLLCTAMAREMIKRGTGKIVMFSRYPQLFEQNQDISGVYDYRYETVGRRARWGYGQTVAHYSKHDELHDRDIFRNEHLIATMCRLSGMTSGLIDLRPYLKLTPRENAAGQRRENQVVIQSSGLAGGPGVMKNKDWYPDRFQAVADGIRDSVNLVQLGQITDPPIQGALDLRGQTTLRESAAILARSVLFLGQVGFLMHLARAVDCRGVIVYGGREIPRITGYIANENMVGPTPCSPCGFRNQCDFDRECMRMIHPPEVIAAVRRQLERTGHPLEIEQVDLSIPYQTSAEVSF